MKLTNLLLSVLLITIVSCESKKSRTLNVQNKSFASEVIIYFAEDSISVQDLKGSVANVLQDFKFYDTFHDSILNTNGYMVRRFESIPEQYLPPTMDYLGYSAIDMSQEDQATLSNLTSGVTIAFFGTKENVIEKQRNIVKVISGITDNKRLFIGDLSAISFYTPRSWKERRVDTFTGNDIMNQVIMHAYREEEFCRIITLGMGKFCLPDLSIKALPCSKQEDFSDLVNVAIATLANDANINIDTTLTLDLATLSSSKMSERWNDPLKKNRKGKGEVKLKFVAPEQGDNLNTQLQMIFEDAEFTSPQEQQNQLLSDLFGTVDKLIQVDHDQELLAASNRAKQRLPELKDLFNQHLQPAISIMLKAPFTTDGGGTEWMWIEVTKWDDLGIEGILQNEPRQISNMKSGATVTAKQEDIFDYILYKADGSMEGNETSAIIEAQEQNR